eukprot:12745909-Alexandrium_andersonii.AAC.1
MASPSSQGGSARTSNPLRSCILQPGTTPARTPLGRAQQRDDGSSRTPSAPGFQGHEPRLLAHSK